ncbi:MAG: amidase family protein, partial [Planctomycetaceae bacterium]|nr:amidase family protein [Planctomycetaceae bacterium]
MKLTPDDAFSTVTQWAQRLRQGETTSVALTEFYLERLERLGPQFNCVVTLARDLALKQAAEADRLFAQGQDRGPLHGI